VVRGADFDEVDVEGEQVVWIDQWIADNVMPDVDPIGQRIFAADADRRIVGIVEDVPYSARGEVSPKVYIPHIQADDRNWALIQTVRSASDADGLLDAARGELAALDPNLVLYRPRPFTEILDVVRAQDRFATFLMTAFALLALTLSLVGTYGVLSGTVATRTREIGIRMALGADSESVRSMVLRYAAGLTLPGVALGLSGAWIASRWLQTLLFEVRAADPVVYVGAVGIFLIIGGLAGWLPARRATRVDTIQVLTAD
jgi:putative ABC transport system permease protein